MYVPGHPSWRAGFGMYHIFLARLAGPGNTSMDVCIPTCMYTGGNLGHLAGELIQEN